MRTRTTLVVFAALAPIMVLAGCGGGGSSNKSSNSSNSSTFAVQPASQRGKETLRIYGFGSGDDVATNRATLAKKAIAPAKLVNPDGGYDPQKFLTQLAGGNVPDLVYLDRQQVATLAAKGTLMPLQGCIDAQHIPISQYRQSALDEASYNGQLYALPEFTNQRALILNMTALKDAGVSPSQVSTTNWDQLKKVAKKLTVMKGGKLTRIGFDPKIPEFFIMWAHANGVDLMSKDGKTVHFDDPKTIEALAYTKSLIDEQGGWNKFQSFRNTFDFFGAKNPVAEDQLAAWPMESWYWNVMADNSPNAPVMAKPFTDHNGQPFTYIGGSGWAIPAKAKNPSLACTWMKTMTSVSTWLVAAQKRIASTKAAGKPFTGLYTANQVADQKILALVPKGSDQWSQAVQTLAAVQKNAIYWPASPGGAQAQQALNDAITRVLNGQQTPAVALKQAQKAAQSAIDQGSTGG